MTLYNAYVPQARKMLHNSLAWLDKAQAYADARGFELDVLCSARLRPDQYTLLRQYQSACDAAKIPAARLLGLQAPVHPDTETSFAQIRSRAAEVMEYLGTFSPEQFEGAETREVRLPFLPGKAMSGADYLHGLALPNFYFHITTAYAILRHNGVDLGKTDFIGPLNLRDVAT